jgi:hypothetical protein
LAIPAFSGRNAKIVMTVTARREPYRLNRSAWLKSAPDRLGPELEESAVTTAAKLCGPMAILATLAVATAPAHAQFEGAGDQMAQFAPMMEQFAPMMEQFAPMMQRMTSKIGKKRMGHMMQAVAPMMLSMMAPGGSMPGMESITGMMGEGSTRRAGRRHR